MHSCSQADRALQVPDDITSLLASLAVPDSGDANRALSFYRGRTLVGRLTYGELVARVQRLAGYLEHSCDVRRGDRVLLLSPNRLEIPVLLLAIWSLGAVAVPLNPAASPEDWKYVAEHAQARGLFVSASLAERFGALGCDLDFALDIDVLAALEGPAPTPVGRHENALAIILYTSGTTGNPKGVGLSQRNLLRNAWSMARCFGLERSNQFAVLPLFHAHALGFGLMTSLVTRGHLVFTDKLDPFAWAEVIRQESVSYASVVPSLLPSLLAARVRGENVATLRALLVSSAPLSTEAAREFESQTGIHLVQGWGLSEYTNFACCLSPHENEVTRRALMLGAELTSIGSPLEGTEVKVTDGEGRILGEGEVGELCVRGHSLMLGYYRDPESTQRTLRDGWLRTGDQGQYRLQDGKPVFYVTGRIKEIIIRGGEKYSPLAIEKRLAVALPELMGKCVVVGFSHRLYGEEIGAYLETESLGDELRARLMEAVRSLPVEMRPKVLLHAQDPIPRTHTGKIQRRKLLPLFAGFEECRGEIRIVEV